MLFVSDVKQDSIVVTDTDDWETVVFHAFC